MSDKIHPSAVIHPRARIGRDVDIGPFVVVGEDVEIGDRTRLMPGCHIVRRTVLGSDCLVNSFAVVGGDPQDLKFKGEDVDLVVGDRNRIGEYATINRGTGVGGGRTVLGNDNMIMAYVHIAHDCIIGNNVVITNSCQLAGHIHVRDMSWISGMCAIHHFVTIGEMSFIAPMSPVRFDVPPYMIVDGLNQNARVRALNLEGLRRRQVPEESIVALKEAFKVLYRRDNTLDHAVEAIQGMPIGKDAYVSNLVNHLIASLNGYQNRALERLRTDKTRVITRVVAKKES